MKRLAALTLLFTLLASPAFAATRFWVGGTGTWDAVTTTNWSATTGGSGGASVPGTSDTVTFDASSGGGTVTLNFGGTITVQSIALGAFTGTWDNSVNNNNITVTAGAGFNGSGTGARTVKLGTATYTMQAAAVWNWGVVTNLTFTGNLANLIFIPGTSSQIFTGGVGLTQGNVTVQATTGAGAFEFNGPATMVTLTIDGPNYIQFSTSNTYTITTTFTIVTTKSLVVSFNPNLINIQYTLVLPAGTNLQWAAIRGAHFTGSQTITNSFDMGNNTGAIIGPVGTGGGACILGGWLLWRDLPNHLNDNFPAWLDKAA